MPSFITRCSQTHKAAVVFIAFVAQMGVLGLLWLSIPMAQADPILYLERRAFEIIRTDPTGREAVIADLMLEIADDPQEQATGLMHRTALLDKHGMIFVFDRPSLPRFWMKDTLIPLDLVYIDRSGAIRSIHANAKPLDETFIEPPGLVMAVIEIEGYSAQKWGLRVGDRLSPWPIQ